MLHFIVNYASDYQRSYKHLEIEALMDEEIETHESEAEVPANSLALVEGTITSGVWYCQAVMGVVHALGSADRPAAELGALIAHAMVGTSSAFYWLTVLLPLASAFTSEKRGTSKMMQCVKVTLLSDLNGYAPPIAVEFGRKTLYSSERPSFIELEEHVRAVKNPQQQTASWRRSCRELSASDYCRQTTQSQKPRGSTSIVESTYADFMTAMMAFFLVMWLNPSPAQKS